MFWCLRYKVSFFRQTTLCKWVNEFRRFDNTQFRHLQMWIYPRIIPEHFDMILLRKARIRLPIQTDSYCRRTESLVSPLSRDYSPNILQQISKSFMRLPQIFNIVFLKANRPKSITRSKSLAAISNESFQPIIKVCSLKRTHSQSAGSWI